MILQAEAEKEEELAPTLKRYWFDEDQIVGFEVSENTRKTVDIWYQSVLQTVTDWPSERPYLELQDMQGIGITPYNRAKAMELVAHMKHLEGRSAVVISQSRMGEILGFWVNNVISRFNRDLKRRVFTTSDEALAWLREGLS